VCRGPRKTCACRGIRRQVFDIRSASFAVRDSSGWPVCCKVKRAGPNEHDGPYERTAGVRNIPPRLRLVPGAPSRNRPSDCNAGSRSVARSLRAYRPTRRDARRSENRK
jgi:hypothetical protein